MDSKNVGRVNKSEKRKEPSSSAHTVDTSKKEGGDNDMVGNTSNQKGDENEKVEKADVSGTGEKGKNVVKNESGETPGAPAASSRPGKRKIIRRVVKQKVVDKAVGAEDTDSNTNDKSIKREVIEEQKAKTEIPGQQGESLAEPGVKTFTRKEVTKNVPTESKIQTEEVGLEDTDGSAYKGKEASAPSSTTDKQDSPAKTTVKKKIIKRVVRRKVPAKTSDGLAVGKTDGERNPINAVKTENTEGKTADEDNQVTKTPAENVPREMKVKTESPQKLDSGADSSKTEIKNRKEEKKADNKLANVKTIAGKEETPQKGDQDGKKVKPKDGDRSRDGDKLKDDKLQKDKDGRDGLKSNSNKDAKEKRKLEEPPRHPGFILKTKWSKDSKVCCI